MKSVPKELKVKVATMVNSSVIVSSNNSAARFPRSQLIHKVKSEKCLEIKIR